MKKILLAVSIILAAGCSKTDSVDPETGKPFREFSAEIDGMKWLPNGVIRYTSTSKNSFWIYCESDKPWLPTALYLWVYDFDSTQDKTYQLGSPDANPGKTSIELRPGSPKYKSVSGEVKLLASKTLIIGTFNAVLVDDNTMDTMVITNGNIKITK